VDGVVKLDYSWQHGVDSALLSVADRCC